MRAALVVGSIVAIGCGKVIDPSAHDASKDAVAEATVEETPTDTGNHDASPVDLGTSCAPINGDAPFGVRIAGPVTWDDTTSIAFSADATLYFPKGRVVGAPAVLSWPRPSGGFFLSKTVLDASLGATGFHLYDGECVNDLKGELIGPDGGITARVELNISGDIPFPKVGRGHSMLCSAGPVASTPTLTRDMRSLLGPIRIAPSLPIDRKSFSAIDVRAGSLLVPVVPYVDDSHVELELVGAAPLAEKALTVDLGGLSDLLGRPFPSVEPISITAPPTGVVTDRSFDTLPASDAMQLSSVTAKIEKGMLVLIPPPSGPPSSYTALLGLGSSPGSTKLTIRHRFDCATTGSAASMLALVSTDGFVQKVKAIICTDLLYEDVLTLPGSGPWFLYLRGGGSTPVPCSYEPKPIANAPYIIDSVVFD